MGSPRILFVDDEEILPTKSISQVRTMPTFTVTGGRNNERGENESTISSMMFNHLCHQEAWLWEYFHITVLDGEEYRDSRTGKIKTDRLIHCKEECYAWSTLDSKRAGSTSNMGIHLRVAHGKTANSQNAKLFSTLQSSLTAWVKKPTLAPQAQLEQNVLKWLVAETLPFTTVEQDSFQQIFSDISGINPPFGSAHTLK